jgi:hypothetical protein
MLLARFEAEAQLGPGVCDRHPGLISKVARRCLAIRVDRAADTARERDRTQSRQEQIRRGDRPALSIAEAEAIHGLRRRTS